MTRSLICAASIAFAGSALAQEVVLKSPDHEVEIKLRPLAGGPATANRFLVTWDKLTGGARSGALVYRQEQDSTEHRYFAIGKVGEFSLVDRGEATLVAGTAVPVYQLWLHNAKDPLELRVASGERPAADAMRADYERAQGLASQSATKAQVQASLDAAGGAFQQACGAKPTFDVSWKDFDKPGRAWLASELGAVAEGIADKCADKDFKAAIAKLTTFRARFDDAAGDDPLKLKRSGGAIELTVGSEIFNPRQRAAAWIAAEL